MRKSKNQRYGSPVFVAEYLDCTERTVRNLIAAGKLTGYRLGNRSIRIDLDEVDAYLRRAHDGGDRVAAA
ncbi:helix-turn-helix domain-containing protein [Ammonicoccus fulvus]|uniref:Helix-turn-helix domain-containing protein n=1 Tax=Ammonicoccus fulvus TaxID=3138240 RepID=A0ABZ3FWI9_9ACTN